jgi:hypothetical protein
MELSNPSWRPKNEFIAVLYKKKLPFPLSIRTLLDQNPRSGFPKKPRPGSRYNKMDPNYCVTGR